MSLINSMTYQEPLLRDAHGDIVELEDWSEDIARDHARELGMQLSGEHLKVLEFMRRYYMDGGNTDSATAILRALEERFSVEGGGKYLYRLFPGGPISQGMPLAGLPRPAFASDRSFGSVR
jgi:tRNA 2-thiouridine synthesizing protein E